MKERKKERKRERIFGKDTHANLLDLSVVEFGFILNDSSVSVVNRLWDGERGIEVQFPAGRRGYTLFPNAKTGSVSNPAPYLMGARLVKLTAHFHGSSDLGMRKDITPPPPPP